MICSFRDLLGGGVGSNESSGNGGGGATGDIGFSAVDNLISAGTGGVVVPLSTFGGPFLDLT